MAFGQVTSFGNVKRGVEVYRQAALALKDLCPGQSAARAYYQVHIVAEHIALLIGPPLESVRDGKRLGKLVHDDVARVVEMVFAEQAKRGLVVVPHLTVDTAFEYAESLHKARMEADYRPYLPFAKPRAQQLLVQAHTLTNMLLAEAEHIEQLRKASTPQPKQGEAS